MTTFTEIVATAVVQSSALALSHFGVTTQPVQVGHAVPPAAERVISRTPSASQKVMKLTSCPRPAHKALPIHT